MARSHTNAFDGAYQQADAMNINGRLQRKGITYNPADLIMNQRDKCSSHSFIAIRFKEEKINEICLRNG